MRRPLACVVVLALLGAGAALGGPPQERITAADQARARAMLLRKSDVGLGFRASPPGPEGDTSCKALDESDLTVTGEARSPNFVSGLVTVASNTDVYESVADANASWKRGTSAGGLKCLRDTVRREYAKRGLRLLALRKTSFPAVAPKTVAFHVAFSGQAQGLEIRAYVDLVALQQSRAQTSLAFASAIDPLEQPEQVRLARIVASRMARAMRGS